MMCRGVSSHLEVFISSRSTFAAVGVAAVAWGGGAAADRSRNGIAAFNGELGISKGELPAAKKAKDPIAKIKAARLKEVSGEAKNDVPAWLFHYKAFLSKTGANELTLEFWTPDKKLAANKRITRINPKD